MAIKKVNDASLTSVANAIRTKGGTSANLYFPDGFVDAIEAIPTGGDTFADLYLKKNHLHYNSVLSIVPLKYLPSGSPCQVPTQLLHSDLRQSF